MERNGMHDRSQVEMDDIIIRALQGRADPLELERLRFWRDECSENEGHYRALSSVWRAAGLYETRTREAPPPVSAIWQSGRPSARFRRPRDLGLRVGAIAALVVVSMGLGQFLGMRGGADPSTSPNRGSEVVTGVGETSTAVLEDGSVVRLGPRSRLIISPDGVPRAVDLHGTAFFAIAHDPERPFRVQTPAGEARVLGTRFEMSTQDQDLRVVVVEGRVAVSSAGGEVEVGRSQVSHVRQGGKPSLLEVDDVWALVDWIGGFLAFESTPLEEVGEELQRRFNVTLELADPRLAEETVTARFGEEPLDEVLAVLCTVLQTRCQISGSVVRMVPGGG